jgi:transcriptional regulator with XRE-family HTH domain
MDEVTRSRALDVPPLVAAVAANVRRLRELRRWSAEHLAELLRQEGGVDIGRRAVLANLESGRRRTVSVDELAALGAVFHVEPWSLTRPESLCLACRNEPPAGFACTTCGRAA